MKEFCGFSNAMCMIEKLNKACMAIYVLSITFCIPIVKLIMYLDKPGAKKPESN